jgi:DASS family divalent anion:Na+ symporter
MNKKHLSLAAAVLIGLILWVVPEPHGVKPEAWRLFAIFTSTILAIILKALPMGTASIFSLAIATLTNTLTFTEAFTGFSNEVVWLVVIAFFISRAFVSTGLGSRLAYTVMALVGKSSLGLGYGLVVTDLILAPAIPSVTARAGGIVYPILRSLIDVFTGPSHDPKMGAFLTLSAFQGTAITSAMFLTAMAGNPLIAELARSRGIHLTWGGWALAAIVPGLISLAVIPFLIYRIFPPVIRKTPHAREMAEKKLKALGSISSKEWIVIGTFALLLVLWILGPCIAMKAAVAALVGLSILLATGILAWKDLLEERSAWDTFIWFATLVTLASALNTHGFTTWFSQWVVSHVSGFEWIFGFSIVALIYFYSHYLFASNVAHIGAMYAPFLIVAVALGTPPELAALVLAFFSSLFGGLTQYGSGPAPIFFAAGFVSISDWWKMGAVVGLANILIWGLLGGLWWKVLGLW